MCKLERPIRLDRPTELMALSSRSRRHKERNQINVKHFWNSGYEVLRSSSVAAGIETFTHSKHADRIHDFFSQKALTYSAVHQISTKYCKILFCSVAGLWSSDDIDGDICGHNSAVRLNAEIAYPQRRRLAVFFVATTHSFNRSRFVVRRSGVECTIMVTAQ